LKRGGLIGSGVRVVVAALPEEGVEPNPPELFSGQQVDDEVRGRVEADQKVRQTQAGLHERGHDAGFAFVRTET
jgi:hypothetical protein